LFKEEITMKEILDEFSKKFGKGSIMYLEEAVPEGADVEFIPTGSFAIDYAIGRRGLPLGRIMEISGFESVGKSTVLAAMIGTCQRLGGVGILIDTEHSYSPDWATTFNIDAENLLLIQPDHLEQASEMMLFLTDKIRTIHSNKPVLIGYDSIAATPTENEISGDAGVEPGKHARILSRLMRQLTGKIWEHRVAVVFVNQLREKVNFMFAGGGTAKMGGHAINFHAAVLLELKKLKQEPHRVLVEVKVVKNKLAPPFRKANFYIDFQQGIDDSPMLAELAETHGIVEKGKQGWYKFGDKNVQRAEVAAVAMPQLYESFYGPETASALLRIKDAATRPEGSIETTGEPVQDSGTESKDDAEATAAGETRTTGVKVYSRESLTGQPE
jgi:recombination protein RecA